MKHDPAFPCVITEPFEAAMQQNRAQKVQEHYGLTKREVFAALAMQGLSSNSDIPQDSDEIAAWAVIQADALIEELEK